MKIAIPTENGVLSAHFGHCEKFILVDVSSDGDVSNQEEVDAPKHQPGLFPRWLASLGAEVIIAGGMGQRAKVLFEQNGIKVVTGASTKPAKDLVADYMKGNIVSVSNPCSGGHGDCGDHEH
jgi:ATP-binding protein involved in chromosome partitioning